MRLSAPAQLAVPPAQEAAGSSVPAPHRDASAPAQALHGQVAVSVSGSKSVPPDSVGWYRPSQCPASCAAM